jgi:hypothetical protein
MTFVDEFVVKTGGPSQIDLALGEIEHFFREALPRAALRLCCVGLSGGHNRKTPSWAPMENLTRELFKGHPAESIVDKHKIKRFAHDLHDQREPKHVHAYIGLLVCHMLSTTPNLKKQSAIAEGLEVFDFPAALERYCSTRDGKHLDLTVRKRESQAKEPAVTTPTRSIRHVLGVGKQDSEEIGQRFFSKHGRISNEESYYACYRYSMSKPEIVKTFLTFRSPTSEVDHFTFRHIYEYETGGGSAITKVADGEVMYLDGAFYFLGG